MRFLRQELTKHCFLIRFFPEEDLLIKTQDFVKKQKIQAGYLAGIGAVKQARIGFFDGEEYLVNQFNEDLEIVSLTGNIAMDMVHMHGIFAQKDGKCVGGHIMPGCIVSVTCELHIFVLIPAVSRKEDPLTQLKLLDLPEEMNS